MMQSAAAAIPHPQPETEQARIAPREHAAWRVMVGQSFFPVDERWRDFANFLADLGPQPRRGVVLTFFDGVEKIYGPGRVAWADPGEKPARTRGDAEREEASGSAPPAALAPLAASTAPAAAAGFGPARTPPSFAPIEREDYGDGTFFADAPWLPGGLEARNAFIGAFSAWRRLLPEANRANAKPAFFFLVTVLPTLREKREILKGAGLWDPLGTRAIEERDAHVAWRRWCDLMPRAQAALSELSRYQGLSLMTQLDETVQAVMRDEAKLRAPPEPRRRPA